MRLELTRKTDLATRAILDLDRSGTRLKTSVLAEHIGTTPGFLSQVMTPLVGQGWVRSEPGPTGGYSLVAALVCEVVMTAMFLVIILGATDERAPKGFAPIAIGLGLTLIHLISIPVTNTSVNPARSTGVAVFVGGWAVEQLWLFWVAPIAGALLGAAAYRMIG